MKPTTRLVEIVEFDGDAISRVQAVLTRDVDYAAIDHVETQWWEPRRQLEAIRRSKGQDVPHAHWNWSLKATFHDNPGLRLVAVSHGGFVQGMMGVWDAPCRDAENSKKQLTYLAYLETAPWNLFPPGHGKQYGLVGTVLLGEAIRISIDSDHAGQIGLHSLAESAAYYRETHGLTDFGPDPACDGMPYFEYNSEKAREFLARSRQ